MKRKGIRRASVKRPTNTSIVSLRAQVQPNSQETLSQSSFLQIPPFDWLACTNHLYTSAQGMCVHFTIDRAMCSDRWFKAQPFSVVHGGTSTRPLVSPFIAPLAYKGALGGEAHCSSAMRETWSEPCIALGRPPSCIAFRKATNRKNTHIEKNHTV